MAITARGDGGAGPLEAPSPDWVPLESLQTPRSRRRSQAARASDVSTNSQYAASPLSPPRGARAGSADQHRRSQAPTPSVDIQDNPLPLQQQSAVLDHASAHSSPSEKARLAEFPSRADTSTPLGRRRLKSQGAWYTPEELSEFGPLGMPAPDVSERYFELGSRSRRASQSVNASHPLRLSGQSAQLSRTSPVPQLSSSDREKLFSSANEDSSSRISRFNQVPRSGTPQKSSHRHSRSIGDLPYSASAPVPPSMLNHADLSHSGDGEWDTSIPHQRVKMHSVRRKRLSQLHRGELDEQALKEFGPLGGLKRTYDDTSQLSQMTRPSSTTFNEIPTVARRARLSRAHEILAAAAAAGGQEAQRQLTASRNDPNFDMSSALASCGLVETWDIHGNPYDLKEVNVPNRVLENPHSSQHEDKNSSSVQDDSRSLHDKKRSSTQAHISTAAEHASINSGPSSFSTERQRAPNPPREEPDPNPSHSDGTASVSKQTPLTSKEEYPVSGPSPHNQIDEPEHSADQEPQDSHAPQWTPFPSEAEREREHSAAPLPPSLSNLAESPQAHLASRSPNQSQAHASSQAPAVEKPARSRPPPKTPAPEVPDPGAGKCQCCTIM